MDPKYLPDLSGEMLRVAEAAQALGITEQELRRIFALGGLQGGFTPTGTLLLQKNDVDRLAKEMADYRGAERQRSSGER